MNMKRIIYIIVFSLYGISISAQSKSSETEEKLKKPTAKELKKVTESAPAIVDYLKARCEKLSEDYHQKRDLVARYEKRKKPEMTEEELKGYLSQYSSISTIYENKDEVGKVLKQFPSNNLAETYLKILDMLESTYVGYREADNKAFCDWLSDTTIAQPLEKHRKEYDQLKNGILDYSYTMFDLARVFRKIKRIIGDKPRITRGEIIMQLQNDEDLEYINRIPYAQKALNTFVAKYTGKNVDNFEEVKKQLVESYPVEFENFDW
ncbi:hypothetical protein DXA74_13255 [Bacteroides sp. OF04-15BH]|nr:hypothetical protein DXA74_13255 [Bacteroides sp. OF04-15BH]